MLILAAIGVVFVVDSVEVVNPGEVGVPVTLGNIGKEVLEPGVHIRTPIITSVKKVTTQEVRSDVTSDAMTRDTQSLPATSIAVNWYVTPSEASNIVRSFGSVDNFYNRIVAPNIEEALKGATAQYTSQELLTKRQEFSIKLKQLVGESLKGYPITITGLNVVNFGFSEEFVKATEANQIASRLEATAQAEARAKVAKAEGEAQAAIAEARGKAESQRLLQQSLTPAVLQARQQDNERAAIEKWDGKLPQVVSGDSELLFSLPTTTNP